MAAVDFINKTFNDWKVLGKVGTDLYKCKCLVCGFERDIRGYYLKTSPPKCKHNDILHKVFGELEVVEKLDNGMVRCKCSCGAEKIVHRRYLQNGVTTSCGHTKTGITSKLIDITGQTFGHWHVEGYYKDKLWFCKCTVCGREKIIRGHLLRGKIPDCMCDTQRRIAEENLQKFGVRSLKQLNSNRTIEQIRMYDTKEAMENTIKSTEGFNGEKPTIRDIAEKIGIDATSVLRFIRKYKLEDLVQIGIYRSHYETDIGKLFPCNNISNRSALNGMEIDLYYPEIKFGIEFNGNYWHSELNKPKSYHQDKSIAAVKSGIFLMHIFEYEWINKDTQEKIVQIIKNRFNTEGIRKIYARNCKVVHISTDESNKFLKKYHIQNDDKSDVKLGLLLNNELIGVMTFGKPRFNSNYQYELIRLAFKSDVTVVGGAEKLFKHFIDEYNPDSIISYCNISKFSGNVYIRLGFKAVELTEPSYRWVNIVTNESLTRYQTMKHSLIEKGLGKENQTEDEIMHSLNYYKIYDCGNLKCVWERT